MTDELMDALAKDRMLWVTQFADALVYLVDVNEANEDNNLIVSKAKDGVLCDYIFEKYGDTPILQNSFDIARKRYLNPLYRDGFETAESREKYKHAKNNGLLNTIGVSLDIIQDWENRINSVIEEIQEKKIGEDVSDEY